MSREVTIRCDACKEVIGEEGLGLAVLGDVTVKLSGLGYDLGFRPVVREAKGKAPDLCKTCLAKGAKEAALRLEETVNPSAGDVTLSLAKSISGIGLDAPVAVSMKNDGPVRAIQMVIRFDPSELTVIGVEPTARVEGMSLEWNAVPQPDDDEAEVRVAIVGMEGQEVPGLDEADLPGNLAIAEILVHVGSVPAHLRFVTEGEAITQVSASATSHYRLALFAGSVRRPEAVIGSK